MNSGIYLLTYSIIIEVIIEKFVPLYKNQILNNDEKL